MKYSNLGGKLPKHWIDDQIPWNSEAAKPTESDLELAANSNSPSDSTNHVNSR